MIWVLNFGHQNQQSGNLTFPIEETAQDILVRYNRTKMS